MTGLLEGKVCIVTGAGKGIGRDTAKFFCEHGATLALISRTEEDLKSLADELGLDDSRLFYLAGDVSDTDIVESFVEEVISRFGRIDVLINNAGMRFRKKFLHITTEEWELVQRVNAGSTFHFCKFVGKHMVKQKSGRIVNMASIVGTLGLAELCAYGASKGTIISLTKSLAIEFAEYNINVNAIAPGFCETSYAESFKKKEDLYSFTIERTPKKAWGTGVDIAKTCLYLSSNLSDYVTGEVISVDGGWSAW